MRIGFIGVGVIGAPMARRLVAAGFEVRVCDRSPAALEPFRRDGRPTSSRPADCAGAEAVIVMVADDAQVRDVLLGPDGLVQGLGGGPAPVVAVMSSVLPDTVREVAAALRDRGVGCVDAPVSGGAARAAEGGLTIMAGGDEANLARLAPVFDALARRTFHCGGVGAGESVKILNNILGVTNTFLMTETLRMARALGVDATRLTEIMEASSGRNFGTSAPGAFAAVCAANAATRDSARAVAAVCRKDLRLARSLAKAAKVPAPLLDSVASSLEARSDDAVYEAWRSVLD
jgi:3-hydroxyisobutyrate dehydrogenase